MAEVREPMQTPEPLLQQEEEDDREGDSVQLCEVAALQQQSHGQRSLISRLEAIIEEQASALRVMQHEKVNLDETLGMQKAVQGKCDILQGQVGDLESAVQSQEAEIQGLEQENMNLQGQLHASDEELEDARSFIDNLKREKASLEDSLTELHSVMAAHEATEKALLQEKAELVAQVEFSVHHDDL